MPSSEPLDTMMETFSIVPFAVVPLPAMTHRPFRGQMQPRGLGMPAIFAASLAGPLGKSWYSSLMLTPEVLLSARTLGPVPLSAYSCRMNSTTRRSTGGSLSSCGTSTRTRAPGRACDLRCHLLTPLLWVVEKPVVVDHDVGARVNLDRHVGL